MPVSVVTNTIADAARRAAFGDAVVAGIGDRPSSEPWLARILEPASGPEYVVHIQGPGGFVWRRAFLGPYEQTETFVRDEVWKATHETT